MNLTLKNYLKTRINSDITFDEAYKVIMAMRNSLHGNNGLTLGFYKKFFYLFGMTMKKY